MITTVQSAGPVPAPTIALTLSIYLTLYLALTAVDVAPVFRLARNGALAAEEPQAAAAGLQAQPRLCLARP